MMLTSQAVPIIVRVIAPHIGATMARSATEAQCQKLAIAETLGPEQLDALLGKLEGGLNIFLGRDSSAEVIAQVRRALSAEGIE